jgi:hypothetical protein
VWSGSWAQWLFIKRVIEQAYQQRVSALWQDGTLGYECRSKPKKEQPPVTQDEEEVSLILVTATLIRPEAG